MTHSLRYRLVLASTGLLLTASALFAVAPVAADEPQAGAVQNTSVQSGSTLDKDDPSDSHPVNDATTATGLASAPAANVVAAPAANVVTAPSAQQTAPFVGSGTQATYDADRN